MKKKIQEVPGEDRYDVYAGGRIVSVPKADITIWDMKLTPQMHAQYAALDYKAVPKPAGREKVSIDYDVQLPPKDMYALQNRIAMVTSWYPLDSDERPWKALAAKSHFMVLRDDGGAPVGFAQNLPVSGTNAVELKYIGLRDDMIGQGLGRYFQTTVLARMAQNNPGKDIVLGTTSFDVFNGKLAREFHEHMGFVVTGEMTKRIIDTREYYKIPEVAAKYYSAYRRQFGALAEPKL